MQSLREGMERRLFDNHIKGPWKTLSCWFVMVIGQTTHPLTGGESWTIMQEYGNLPYPLIVRNHDVSHPVNCFVTILNNETTGADAKPGGDIMVL